MARVEEVVAAAEKLGREKDEDALELLLGMRDKAIEEKPALSEKADIKVEYAPHMGLIDELKSLGRSIALEWSKQLHKLVCGAGKDEDRQKILDALNLGETAVIGAVAAALMGMAVPAPLAAAAAPLIVKRFIWPARKVLFEAWGEALATAPPFPPAAERCALT